MYSETKQPAEKHKKHIRFIMNYKKKNSVLLSDLCRAVYYREKR